MNRLLCALYLATAAAATAELPPLPRPATSFGATIAGDWLYVYGGNTGKAHEFHRECVKGDFFRLHLPDGTAWEQLPSGPALLSPALVAQGDRVIRIGGMMALNAPDAPNDLHSTGEVSAYDPLAAAWTPLPALPQPRSSHDAALQDGTLYVGGGWKLDGPREGTWVKTMLTLDLRTPGAAWREVEEPFTRRALAAAAHRGRIWFIGGMDGDNKPSREVDWFEPASGQWGKGPALPAGIMEGFGAAACTSGGRLFISPLTGQISMLDAQSAAWAPVTTMATPRFFHRLLSMGSEQLLAVGGSNRERQVSNLELISLGQAPAPLAKPQ